MRSALDTLAATGLPIWLTEVDVQAPPNVQQSVNQVSPKEIGGSRAVRTLHRNSEAVYLLRRRRNHLVKVATRSYRKWMQLQPRNDRVFEESELDGNGRKNPSREQANIVTGLEKSKETVDHENVETGKRDERVRDANMEDDVKVVRVEDDVKVVRVEDDFEESPPYKPGHQRYLSGQVRYIFCIPREHLQ
ncbi:hypothetical protein DY000_02027837 [Brassica cretica]|uniref:Uncharacterized protein n=1 Tax=Brassica cretica TaxID=69181 RepID=A0ABQ7EE41_BRACR|nr:hypothetical protein DY000_02027837 [Brassica cretica]